MIRRFQVVFSSDIYFFAFVAALVSLAATRAFVIVKTMTSQADRTYFVSANGDNVFQNFV